MTARTRVQPPRGAIVGLCVAAALLVAALVGGRPGRDGPPLDPRSDGPLGTSALVSLLRGLGADVELSVGLPTADDDAALVLQDRLDEQQADDLTRWVRDGGTLVVTDTGSVRTPALIDQGLDLPTGPVRQEGCSIAALESITEIEGGAAARFEVSDADEYCFGSRRDGAFVVSHALGRGQVVAVGGAAFITNDLLDDRDNAVLAATLLAPSPGATVRFVDPPVPAGGGDKTLADLVPIGVTRALLQLGVAFVLYALWRAIRLGRPVTEDQAVEVAGSALVGAMGRLLSRTHAPGAAAETLRRRLRSALRARLAVPADAPIAVLVEITAARSGAAVEDVVAAIDERPVTTDADLVAVARAVASIHQEVHT